jgi:hypothetical protein
MSIDLGAVVVHVHLGCGAADRAIFLIEWAAGDLVQSPRCTCRLRPEASREFGDAENVPVVIGSTCACPPLM